MTYGELDALVWDEFWDKLSDKSKIWINSKPGYKENIYCGVVSFVSSMLSGIKFYEYTSDEISGELISIKETKNYEEAFFNYMLNNYGLTMTNKAKSAVISIVNNNKTNLTIK